MLLSGLPRAACAVFRRRVLPPARLEVIVMDDKKEKKRVMPKKNDKPRKETCVCNMEWRSSREGEEWNDCICTPEPGKEKAVR
jgi:hypothetical protein